MFLMAKNDNKLLARAQKRHPET